MQSNDNKNSSVIHKAVAAVAVVLMLSVCVCILTFMTNGVVEVDVDDKAVTDAFERTTVTTVIEQLEREEDLPPPVEEEEEEEEEPTEPEERTISFFGDSITSYRDQNGHFNTAYPNFDVDSVDETWWMQVVSRGGYTFLTNSSSSGSFTVDSGDYSAQTQERIDFLDPESKTVIVFMGMNDYAAQKGVDRFRDAYTSMLGNIKARCADASIICCTVYAVDVFESNRPVAEYNAVINEVAKDASCSVVDLSTLDMSTAKGMTGDGVHPTEAGMTAIADLVLGVAPKPEEPKPEEPKPKPEEPKPDDNPPGMPEDSNAKVVYDILLQSGYDKESACAILGNMHVETGGTFNPKADANGNYYGLCQWDSKVRFPALLNWANSQGLDGWSLKAQAMYVAVEATNTSGREKAAPKGLNDPYATLGSQMDDPNASKLMAAQYVFLRWFEGAIANGYGKFGTYSQRYERTQGCKDRETWAQYYYDLF